MNKSLFKALKACGWFEAIRKSPNKNDLSSISDTVLQSGQGLKHSGASRTRDLEVTCLDPPILGLFSSSSFPFSIVFLKVPKGSSTSVCDVKAVLKMDT